MVLRYHKKIRPLIAVSYCRYQRSGVDDFISKLYLEVSYLIKEIEGLLYQEEEKFIIGRPAGYGITARKTTGLDANNLSLWLMRKFAVFFIPEEQTKKEKGQTITAIDEKLKVLYLRFILDGDEVKAPTIYSGILHKIDKKPQAKGIKKFEHIMGHLEYNDLKIFKNIEKLDYEDAYIKLSGQLIENHLFEINDSEEIEKRIINPSLALYRGN
jgi:hypothetical protein